MTQVKTRYRKDPKPGTVIMVPLAPDCFIYFVSLDSFWSRFYDFYTDYPVQNPKYFPSRHWREPFMFSWKMYAAYLDICHPPFTDEELKVPPTVRIKSEEHARAFGNPTRYSLERPKGGYDYITKEEADKMYPMISLQSPEVVEHAQKILPELRRIEVPPEDRWTPPATLDESQLEPEPVLLEVHFFVSPEAMGSSADLIAEELGDALDLNGLGGLMTMDSADGTLGSDFEVVLEVEPKRIKGALTQIRKTLKRIKAPATTRILEVSETGNIEHPLVALPKEK